MANQKNTTQDLAILAIQKDIEFIKCELTEIKQNHLHEINEDIKGLNVKIVALKEELDKRPTWSITMLVSVTVGLISFIIANFFVR